MSKKANIMTRVEPEVKAKAEAVLDQLSLKNLNDEQFDALMDKAMESYASGHCTDIDEYKKELQNLQF